MYDGCGRGACFVCGNHGEVDRRVGNIVCIFSPVGEMGCILLTRASSGTLRVPQDVCHSGYCCCMMNWLETECSSVTTSPLAHLK